MVLASVTLIGCPADGGSPPTIAGAMTTVRELHAHGRLGGNAGGSAPLMTVNGFVVETAAAVADTAPRRSGGAGFKCYADAVAGVDISPADTAMIGSQTKTLTAAAILQLDQEGRLSIKDTLGDPKWADTAHGPNAQAITLEMLLSHTSEHPDFTTTKAFQEAMSDPALAPSPADLLALACGAEPTFAPGDGWSYSNTGYILLGVIIEKVTGNTYASELQDRFFGPLGLTTPTSTADRASPRPCPAMSSGARSNRNPGAAATAARQPASPTARRLARRARPSGFRWPSPSTKSGR